MKTIQVNSVETFAPISPWEMNRMVSTSPSCFNGIVQVRRYRVIVEAIVESDDVIYDRLLELWRTSDNSHHMGPLKAAAKEIGRELPSDQWRINQPARRSL